ncbi:MAG: hypothetical protein AB7E81_24965 [Hyphomicrobiaceae bacterium]
MLIRSAVVLTFASLVAGCANDAPNLASFAVGPSALAITTPAAAAAAADIPMGEPAGYRKTMSDRVLAAMALERVTGLKPDPSRLAD